MFPFLCLGLCLADVSFNLTYLPRLRRPTCLTLIYCLSNISGFDCMTAGTAIKPTGSGEIYYKTETAPSASHPAMTSPSVSGDAARQHLASPGIDDRHDGWRRLGGRADTEWQVAMTGAGRTPGMDREREKEILVYVTCLEVRGSCKHSSAGVSGGVVLFSNKYPMYSFPKCI